MHQERTYRHQLYHDGLISFRTVVKETDLFIQATMDLDAQAKESILLHRGHIESFIQQYPDFSASLAPLQTPRPVPNIVADMLDAAHRTGVGPMAAVAGAIAEYVGHDLLQFSREIIIENGGDVFMRTHHPVTIGIFANRSPLSMRMGLKIDGCDGPMAVCTSSGTVGHSISFGTADAVTVVSPSCPLADAAATAIANQVKQETDIQKAIFFGKDIKGVKGLVIIKNDKAGMWGNINVVQLQQNKG
jgi:ApbE superfamily uncharacterized protein (UPF0280 family)